MTSEQELVIAEAKSRAARQQLTATMVDIQQRLNPRVLVREVISEVGEASSELLHAGLSHAKRNPGPLLGIAATVIAYFARSWLFGSHGATPEPETDAAAAPAGEPQDEPQPTPPPEESAGKADPAKGNRNLIKTGMKRPPRRKR